MESKYYIISILKQILDLLKVMKLEIKKSSKMYLEIYNSNQTNIQLNL